MRSGIPKSRPQLLALLVAIGCAVAVTYSLGMRIHPAYDEFQTNYHDNAWRNPFERKLATGDTMGFDFEFQKAALSILSGRSTFAPIAPATTEIAQSSYGINDITYNAIPSYFAYFLLPNREVAPEDAQYILCYGCDTTPWDHRVTWLYNDSHGYSIGKVNDQ